METTSGTVTGAGVAGSSSPGGSAPRHAKRLKLSRPAIADFRVGLERGGARTQSAAAPTLLLALGRA
jgi:hypothetical protein